MHYRGWKSTKLHHTLITQAIIAGCYAATGFNPSLFDAFCVAMITASGIYSTSAVAEKFGKAAPSVVAPATPPT